MDRKEVMAPGADGKAGGAGLLWGVELVYRLLRSNRAKSPRRVPHVVSRVCSLAREGLESGHRDPLALLAPGKREFLQRT